MPSLDIPDKLYFRIGEVAKLCGVPAYVLRFWENEFPQLRPNKGGTGQRLYRRRDVEMALRVKTLLYDEGYTIAGARQAFKSELRAGGGREPGADAGDAGNPQRAEALEALRRDLRELHALLLRPPGERAAVRSMQPRGTVALRSAAREAGQADTAAPAPPPLPRPRVLSSQRFLRGESLFGNLDPDEARED